MNFSSSKPLQTVGQAASRVSSPSAALTPGGDIATLQAQPLTAENFATFGKVIGLDEIPAFAVNEGRGTRQDLPALLQGSSLRDACALYTLGPSPLPVRVSLVERHPLTPQLFMPLDDARWLVVVIPAGADGRPDIQAARAFLAGAGQGIVYGAGTWHLPLVVLDRKARFLMRMGESETPEDCQEHVLESPFDVIL